MSERGGCELIRTRVAISGKETAGKKPLLEGIASICQPPESTRGLRFFRTPLFFMVANLRVWTRTHFEFGLRSISVLLEKLEAVTATSDSTDVATAGASNRR